MKGRYLTVQMGSYPQKVVVSVGHTALGRCRVAQKLFPKNKFEPKDFNMRKSVAHTFQLTAGHNFMIALEKWDATPYDYACLVHEIGHVLFYVVRYVGGNFNEDSDEHNCYTLDYLTLNIANGLCQ